MPATATAGTATAGTATAGPATAGTATVGTPGFGARRRQALPRTVAGRAVLGAVTVCCLLVVVFHLLMVFLWNAPENAATKAVRTPMRAWMVPMFSQDWQLFAPNPWSSNTRMKAQARVRDADGKTRETAWTDLSERDLARIRGNPVPDRTVINGILKAASMYFQTHDGPQGERSSGDYSILAEDYLYSIAARRLGDSVGDGEVVAVRVQLVTTFIKPPPWSEDMDAQDPTTVTLDWAEVPDDY
jgi:hypothetical protein